MQQPISVVYTNARWAYRYWAVRGGLLSGVVFKEIWPPFEAARARCSLMEAMDSLPRRRPWHESPAWECRCGIYGSFWPIVRDLEARPDTVRGIAAFWGDVIVHEDGLRAELAYPVVLVGDFIGELAEKYGARVARSMRQAEEIALAMDLRLPRD